MSRDSRKFTRREVIGIGVTTGLSLALDRLPLFAQAGPLQQPDVIKRAIPSSGEKITVVGIGTARRYDVGDTEAERAPLREVLRRFPEMGGQLIDTAPGYGRAEAVAGDLIRELKIRDRYFVATKVSARGGDAAAARAQFDESLRRFGTDRIDLLQVHNLSSPQQLLPVLEEWKQAKRIRYLGVTTSSDRQYEQLEALMRARPMDFIQVDYAIDNRGAAERILPLAADRGMGVLINLPFGRTRVFQKVTGKPLPEWAKEIDATSWAQVFLKYIVGHPSVTAVIPGTAKVEYLVDNIGAARGRLPDEAMRKRIEAYFDAL